MIRKAADCKKEYRENMRGGNGTVEVTNFASPAELNDKGRLFANITLRPGCSIGYHVHEKDSELFYLMKGEVVYNDNGVECIMTAGDVMICSAGTGHAVANNSQEDAVICAVIVYA
ncbi:MAG: cupin domain-containing protein [Clostridiales bacterium]|nr:cupin domain-containing protein [Clostridiales bacterium]